MASQADEQTADVPENPDLEPEKTVDALEQRTVGNLPSRDADPAEADGDTPAIEQYMEPDQTPGSNAADDATSEPPC